MRQLKLTLNIGNLSDATHVWFPVPQGMDKDIKIWFNVSPLEIQTDRKYGSSIAYFYFKEVGRIKILTEFPVYKIAMLSRHGGTPRNDSNKKQFLHPSRFVQSDDKVIRKLANTLIENLQTDEEKARRCFDFVVDYLIYANPIRGLYSSLQALTDRQVDCGGFSTLLAALLRSINIPARCVFGWAIQSKLGYHAWTEYFDRQKQKWVAMDPSAAYLGKRTKLRAGFGFINDERVIFSVGEEIELLGRNVVWETPLLQSPVVVSLDEDKIPQSIIENLKWKIK